jgi:hypothetical protein
MAASLARSAVCQTVRVYNMGSLRASLQRYAMNGPGHLCRIRMQLKDVSGACAMHDCSWHGTERVLAQRCYFTLLVATKG